MDSGVSRFKVSLTVRGKRDKTVSIHCNFWRERRSAVDHRRRATVDYRRRAAVDCRKRAAVDCRRRAAVDFGTVARGSVHQPSEALQTATFHNLTCLRTLQLHPAPPPPTQTIPTRPPPTNMARVILLSTAGNVTQIASSTPRTEVPGEFRERGGGGGGRLCWRCPPP